MGQTSSKGWVLALPGLAVLLCVLGCGGPAQMATAQTQPIDVPPGTLSVYRLAGRLGLHVEQSNTTLATLCNPQNCVRVFGGSDGRAFINGRCVAGPAPVPAVGDMLFVPLHWESAIRQALARAPARHEPARHPPATVSGIGRGCIVIDAGHGGKDTGAIAANGVTEKSLNLPVALALAQDLRRRGFEVCLTRSGDSFLELNDRADLANARNARLFVSIHSNAVDSPSVRGYDVYVARSASREALAAAASLTRQLDRLAIPRHGAQPKRADFRVLVRTACPSVLVEMGFMTNGADLRTLCSPAYQAQVASALAQGIAEYLSR